MKNNNLLPSLSTAAGCSLLLLNTFSVLHAAEYTWTFGNAGNADLSDSAKWAAANGAVPVNGATDAVVTFLAAQAAGSTLTVTNNLEGTLVLNRLNFTNSNSSGTAPIFNLTGNALNFVANGVTAPVLSLNPTGTTAASRPKIVISNDITLDNDLTLSQSNASVSATLSGVIDGIGGLQKTSGTGSVTISNSSNSFTGPVVISANGFLSVPMLGKVSLNSPLGTNGSITLGGGSNSGQLTWTGNITESTDKVFTLGGTTGGGTISASTSGQTLTISSALISGTSTSNRSLTLTGNGNIAFNGTIGNGTGASGGVVSVVKSGAGTVTLGGGNGYTGGTTLSAGTLALGNNSALGTGSLAVTANSSISAVGSPTIANAISIAGTFTATFNIGTSLILTDSGIISGAGALTKSGSGTLVLSNTANSFSGVVSVNAGTLSVANVGNNGFNSSIGTNGTINIGNTSTTGTLRLLGSVAETTDKVINMAGQTGGVAIIAQGGAVTTFTSALSATGSGAKTLALLSSGSAVGIGINFNGLISDLGGSAISVRVGGSGDGTFSLGNTNNSFTGGVTIDGNTTDKTYILQVAAIGNSGSNSYLGTNGIINLGSAEPASLNILSYTGSGEITNKVINLSNTLGGAGLEQSGTGLLKLSSNLTVTGVGAKTFTLKGSSAGTGEFAGNIVDGTNPTSLRKDGSGTWTLSGVNTYTGGTNIVAGTLALAASGSIDSSSLVTIGAGATFDTSARSSFSLPAGKTYTFTLDSTDAGSAGRINAADLDISAAAIAFARPLLNPDLDDASYVIATYTGTLTGTFGTAAPDGYSWNYGTGTNSQITLVKISGGYGSWKGTNAGGQAAGLDWDNDSVTNGIEYFMNAPAGFTANPTLGVGNSITWTNGGNILSSAYGTQFVVQTSSDLVSWANVPVGELNSNSDTTLTYTLTGANKRFVRLMVTPVE